MLYVRKGFFAHSSTQDRLWGNKIPEIVVSWIAPCLIHPPIFSLFCKWLYNPLKGWSRINYYFSRCLLAERIFKTSSKEHIEFPYAEHNFHILWKITCLTVHMNVFGGFWVIEAGRKIPSLGLPRSYIVCWIYSQYKVLLITEPISQNCVCGKQPWAMR